MLLSIPLEEAVSILADLPSREAASRLQAIAIVRPAIAAAIFRMFNSNVAGHLLTHLSSGLAADLLGGLKSAAAVRILGYVDDQAAELAIRGLPVPHRVRLLQAMGAARASALLGRTPPAEAAATLRADEWLRDTVLPMLDEADRVQILCHLKKRQ